MTLYTTRSPALPLLLILFLALVVCVNAQPDGNGDFEDLNMDGWPWLSSMGGQFADMIVNDQLPHMTLSQATGGSRSVHPDRSGPFQHSSQLAETSALAAGPSYLPTWGMGNGGMAGAHLTTGDQQPMRVFGDAHNTGQEQSQPANEPYLDSTEDDRFRLSVGYDSSDSGHMSSSSRFGLPHRLGSKPSRVSASAGVTAAMSGYRSHSRPTPRSIPGWETPQYDPHHAAVDQYHLPDYNIWTQIPQMMPMSMGMPKPEFDPQLGIAASNIPEILSSDVTDNYNYESGVTTNHVDNMRGWIGRAPTIGDRAIPRLDTNHLAPPEPTSANRSPTSASTTGSSARAGNKRKSWEMELGDLKCHWCGAAFNTQGDLTHHLRSHAPYMSRQHICGNCQKRFQYRKDLVRHLPKHDPNRKKFYCPIKNCKYYSKGFGRQDHLDRHKSSQHRVDTPQRSARPSPCTA